jgi:hypothetical protein
MKKILTLLFCSAALLAVSSVIAQEIPAPEAEPLSLERIVADEPAAATANAAPAPCPCASQARYPGAVQYPTFCPPQRRGYVTAQGDPAPYTGPVYRATPVRNFLTLMFAPRPYASYDPYGYMPGGYPYGGQPYNGYPCNGYPYNGHPYNGNYAW